MDTRETLTVTMPNGNKIEAGGGLVIAFVNDGMARVENFGGMSLQEIGLLMILAVDFAEEFCEQFFIEKNGKKPTKSELNELVMQAYFAGSMFHGAENSVFAAMVSRLGK